jgi:hypothetical protein
MKSQEHLLQKKQKQQEVNAVARRTMRSRRRNMHSCSIHLEKSGSIEHQKQFYYTRYLHYTQCPLRNHEKAIRIASKAWCTCWSRGEQQQCLPRRTPPCSHHKPHLPGEVSFYYSRKKGSEEVITSKPSLQAMQSVSELNPSPNPHE